MEALKGEKLTKTFGGLLAVNEFDMSIAEGQCIGLIGPNGAGKTTIVNLLSGTLEPTSGRIVFDGRTINGFPPHKRATLGIIRSFQLNSLFWSFTVLDNLRVAFYGQRQRGLAWRSILKRHSFGSEEREFRQKAADILESLGISQLRDRVVTKLTGGQQRQVTFAMSLIAEPKFLLLDEPTAGLSWQEGLNLMEIIRGVVSDRGIGTLVIEHNVRAIVKFVDSIIAMQFGSKIAEGPPAEVVRNEKVVESYLGEAIIC